MKDIAPFEDTGTSGSSPRWLHAMGGKVFFSAADANSDREMWVTDGTGVGTELLVDGCPGPCSSETQALGHAGGLFYWTARTFFDGVQLWVSDGTRVGTHVVTSAEGGIGVSEDRETYALSARLLLFAGCTAEARCELWASDGTVAGTRLVKDFSAGLETSYLRLQAAGGKIFVIRRNFAATEQAVWVTDGTAAGTVLLKDLGAGTVDNLTGLAGGRLFFTFRSAGEGSELWTSDGTAAGTLRLTHFSAAAPFVKPQDSPALKASGRRVYFVADETAQGPELWRSDGTAAGTGRLTDFAFATPFDTRDRLSFVEEIGDRAVFIATDGVSVPKLWTSGGSPASTTALPVPCGGACEFLPAGAELFKAGGRIFFFAGDGVHGQELWTTDGTAAGTRMLRDICPGTCDGLESFPEILPLAEMLLFLANDPVHGEQLWRSDGTAAGTRRISNFQASNASYVLLHQDQGGGAVSGDRIFFPAVDANEEELWMSEGGREPTQVANITRAGRGSAPAWLVPFQGGLAFSATEVTAFHPEVWRSDGSSAGTFPLTSTPSSIPFLPSDLTVAGFSLFFLTPASQSSGMELRRTDGTAAGTLSLVTDRSLAEPTAFAGSLYFFSAELETARYELWKSDGTPAGTRLVAALPSQGLPGSMQAVGGELYFAFSSFSGSRQLWRSDGTPAGTFKLADDFAGSDRERFFRLGARVYYLNRGALWSTDGTPAGTRAVTALADTGVTDFVALGGVLYLIVRDATGEALWRSDGSAAGTVAVAHLPVAAGIYTGPLQLTAAAGRLFFPLADRAHGVELWTSDGTAAGTRLVRDIFPGQASAIPSSLTAAGGRLFFVATDGTRGFELWQSDGTEAGTRLVQDIAPEAASSYPDQLTEAGGRLYFIADDGVTGRELWSLPLAAPAGCQPSPFQLCLSGRYQVEAVWRDFEGHSGRGTGVALTADTGYFWFFDPANVEVAVKSIDGQGLNGHGWVFYGALSNVQYDLTVTDTQTGLARRYSNLAGRFASVGDTHAFGPLGAYGTERPQIAPPSPSPLIREKAGKASAAPCQPSARRLCLNNGRFAVDVDWKDFQSHTGKGTAVPLTGDTGTFWFFNAANIELVVKVLDARPLNGKFWLFYGALSNVEYKLTVTDTQTGTVRTYNNPSGRFASVGDTEAF